MRQNKGPDHSLDFDYVRTQTVEMALVFVGLPWWLSLY
jgi:hypothetical protein